MQISLLTLPEKAIFNTCKKQNLKDFIISLFKFCNLERQPELPKPRIH